MRLRPRQNKLVDLSLQALEKHGNTLAIAPTGAGKTICLSAVAGKFIKQTQGKTLVLAAAQELTYQNESKFKRG
jgi:superfamily II DNA or RNA helicase